MQIFSLGFFMWKHFPSNTLRHTWTQTDIHGHTENYMDTQGNTLMDTEENEQRCTWTNTETHDNTWPHMDAYRGTQKHIEANRHTSMDTYEHT